MIANAEKRVAIIVINWNNWYLSLRCLASLRTSNNVDWHLFLIDNFSTDDSRDHLENLGDDVTVIFAEKNGGWTGGNNIGIKSALDAGYEYFFILNNDASVFPNTISILLNQFDSERSYPVLGPIHRNVSGDMDFIGAGLSPKIGLPVEFKAHEFDLSSVGDIYPTTYVRGAALFIHRKHFDIIGMFDEDFYLYYDDTDWCFRARAKGFIVAMTQRAEITHIGSASVGRASPLLIYFMVRNGLLFVEKYSSMRQRIRYLAWLIRWLSSFSERRARLPRLFGLLVGKGSIAIAARRGIKDYIDRRFGDCPASIRHLSKS